MSQSRHILHYVWAYVLWFISTALAILTLNLLRETVLLAMVAAVSGADVSKSEQFYQSLRAGAVAQWSMLGLGLVTIVLLVTFEHYYRNGVAAGSLKKRFFLVTAIECALLLLTHSLYFALQLNFRPLGWWNAVILAGEVCLTGLFFWLWSKNRVVQPQEI